MVEYKSHSKAAQVSGRLDAAFSAMADPTRRAILARLALADARVTEIAADFPVSLNAGAMAEAAEWIDFYRQFWEDRLASLEAFVLTKRSSAKKGKHT